MQASRRLIIDGRRLTAGRTGVGRYLETLLFDWSRTGWPVDPTVLILQDTTTADRFAGLPGLSVEAVGTGWPGLFWERWGLGRALMPGDLLFAPTNLIPGTWRGPTVLVVFDTLLESVPGGFSALTRLRFRGRYRSAARRASRIIVPSEATGRDVSRYYGIPPDRVRTVYPGIGPGFRPRPPDDPLVVAARKAVGVDDHPFFLFVGKRSRRRNVEALLSAFSGLPAATAKAARLVFVGPDGGHPLPDDRPGLIAAGHVPDEVLLGLLSSAVACLYPSDSEGFGLPVVEAMASGCPVVTVRSGALLESGGDAALYVDRADPESLLRAMLAILTSQARRDEYVRLGLIQASRFGVRAFSAAVCDEIRRAILLSSCRVHS